MLTTYFRPFLYKMSATTNKTSHTEEGRLHKQEIKEESIPEEIVSNNVMNVDARQVNNEPNLEDIENYLMRSVYPASCKSQAGLRKNLRRRARRFHIHNNKLHFKYKENMKLETGPEYCLVVKDKTERDIFLKAAHEGLGETGDSKSYRVHRGRDKTFWKLLDYNVWWPLMKKHVRNYITGCENCQKRMRKDSRTVMEMYTISVPTTVWCLVGVDLFPLTRVNGYVGVCVVTDYYSKWVEAKPVKHTTALEVAGFLQELLCRYGGTKIQINDQGLEFCDEVAKHLYLLMGTSQRITPGYHPHPNRLVENTHSYIQTNLLRKLQEKDEEWPQVLQKTLIAVRTTRHCLTGISPFELMFARKPTLPVAVDPSMHTNIAAANNIYHEESATEDNNIMALLETVQESGIKALLETDGKPPSEKRQKMEYENHVYGSLFKIGTKVTMDKKKGDRSKLPFKGPFLVKGYIESTRLYKLSYLDGRRVRVKQHESSLKEFQESTYASKLANVCHVDVKKVFEKSPKFLPTDTDWREEKSYLLRLFPTVVRKECRHKKDTLGIPDKIDPIHCDGDCLFRAFSKEITLSEEFYSELREATIKVLLDEQFYKYFESYIGKDVNMYLDETKMAEDGTWGTDVEIIALSTLLNTAVAVFHKAGVDPHSKWFFYHPINSHQFNEDKEMCCIYLEHPDTFNRVLSVKLF